MLVTRFLQISKLHLLVPDTSTEKPQHFLWTILISWTLRSGSGSLQKSLEVFSMPSGSRDSPVLGKVVLPSFLEELMPYALSGRCSRTDWLDPWNPGEVPSSIGVEELSISKTMGSWVTFWRTCVASSRHQWGNWQHMRVFVVLIALCPRSFSCPGPLFFGVALLSIGLASSSFALALHSCLSVSPILWSCFWTC